MTVMVQRGSGASATKKDKEFPFATILVATDFSATATAALRYAQALAKLKQAKLVLVHVIDPVGYAFPEGTPAAVSADATARAELAEIEAHTRAQGIQVHSVIETGVICDRILQTVRDHKATLLILGTQATTGAGRAALGAVARQLLVHSPCPILTVTPEAEAQIETAGHWKHVLISTDFSPSSLSALACAQHIAQHQLTVMHTTYCGKHLECPNCMKRLRILSARNESKSASMELFVTAGDPAKRIEEAAQQSHIDLIVLGTPSKELAPGDLANSTIMKVISTAHCPVLIVPPDDARCESEIIRDVTLTF
jgi:nucleotide-binding universal stress UspA family protein